MNKFEPMNTNDTDKADYECHLEQVTELLGKEYNEALQLCRIIREGIRLNIPLQRIKNYTDWYYNSRLALHLKKESEYIFPILGDDHELIKKALTKQRRLKRLFEENEQIEKSLNRIEEELERLIRINEKGILNEVKKCATLEQLIQIEKVYHKNRITEEWKDVFWQN